MTQLPNTTLLDLELNDGWLTIWLNSPSNRNALSDTLMAEFVATLEAVKPDRSVRGITLRGRGGVFCSGGDLKSFASGQTNPSRGHFIKLNRGIGDVFDLLQSMPQVVIAFVEGAAIAGGLGLMCCADVIVVTEDAKFSLTETMIGIVPAQIAPIVVARVGLPKARRLMLTGARFTGAETDTFGLSDFIITNASDFAELEAQLIHGVKRCAPGANGLTKEILVATPYLDREAQKDFAAEKFTDAILSDEGKEGIASFLEKRKPSWSMN
ncbi:enoyl-CoA hydratase/isomerase family protein [Litorimonas sp. RW-G-Af-16]|uniref:enoyl-CoA hydratase/isomerase family protein n=1 Tax=Litorimonas sp. RW-G-Af-16 TaxID=3241168 RepID=UPI00390CD1BC